MKFKEAFPAELQGVSMVKAIHLMVQYPDLCVKGLAIHGNNQVFKVDNGRLFFWNVFEWELCNCISMAPKGVFKSVDNPGTAKKSNYDTFKAIEKAVFDGVKLSANISFGPHTEKFYSFSHSSSVIIRKRQQARRAFSFLSVVRFAFNQGYSVNVEEVD